MPNLKHFEHINKLQTQGGGSSGYEWSLDRFMARDYGISFDISSLHNPTIACRHRA